MQDKKFIVPYLPAGTTDLVARTVGQKDERLGKVARAASMAVE
jgi:tripartite-type tricarboxylate transporter receptor subunit TctC